MAAVVVPHLRRTGQRLRRITIAGTFGFGAAAARAHPVAADAAISAAEPWLLAALAVAALAYAIGTWRLWRHAGQGRGIPVAAAVAYATGWLALAWALLGPLDTWASRAFSAHMVQHELLMVVAAPLLVLGRPLAAFVWALPARGRAALGRLLRRRGWTRSWRTLTHPLSAWSLHALALWAWHLPAAFDAALQHEALHVAQHAGFLASALLFWWSVVDSAAHRGRSGLALLLLFTTMIHSGALGALLALSPSPWYASYAAAGPPGAALADQQLGGLLMWIPAGLVYVIAALAALARPLSAAAGRAATPAGLTGT